MENSKPAYPPIRKILIANRGEIALRIVRAAQELGITTVAVYTDVDRAALHVSHADEAYPLGPSPRAYLQIDLILEAVRLSGADAIHPGYGFLSENVDFASACEEAGIRFIGPNSSAMRILGNKMSARRAADAAKIPRTPGSTKALASLDDAIATATVIGYPVMLKAAAGGGGKGMRAVNAEEELPSAFRDAQSEAERAFGSPEVYLEKLIQRPRHVEIQIIADEQGHCVYLGERECSVQRRHQKVIEEAPSTLLSEELRRRMGEAAVRLASTAGYTSAGTVEFLIDEDRNFYFLEINTRLQVEHPVTELVTGVDIVQLQIQIAQGLPLPFTQSEIILRGHAIECRIYAEDPENNFFPSPGKITRLVRPSGPGIREDCGVYEGWTVPMDYDPLVSKLIAYASNRESAIERMLRALNEYYVCGIRTNLSLLERILRDSSFRMAEMDTGYLDRLLASGNGDAWSTDDSIDSATVAAAAAALFQTLPANGASQDRNNGKGVAPQNGLQDRTWKRQARAENLS